MARRALPFIELPGDRKCRMALEYQHEVNYSLCKSGMKILQVCRLENRSADTWHNVRVTIDENEYVAQSACLLQSLAAHQSAELDTLELQPKEETLARLTEAVDTTFTLRVHIGNEEVSSMSQPICLLPFDQWNGESSPLLASFVTPNHPYIQQIVRQAATRMMEMTGSATLRAYQADDPNDVLSQVAAVYETLRQEQIAYVVHPATFVGSGQRVRMADDIRENRMGNCLHLSLLLASCLECIGLNPIIVLMQSHAMVGVWLTDQYYNRAIGEDRERLLKSSADGVSQLALIEATALCPSQSGSTLDDAIRMAQNKLSEEAGKFQCFVDIKHCRLDRIRPLPQRKDETQGWIVDPAMSDIPTYDEGPRRRAKFDFDFDHATNEPLSRMAMWERKLLDLTMNNHLLNMRPGSYCVPLITLNVHELVSNIQEKGKSYRLLPNPTDKRASVFDCGEVSTENLRQDLGGFFMEGLGRGNLHTYLKEENLATDLRKIAKQAKVNMEESGATSLFLTVGLLHWVDDEEPMDEEEASNKGRRRRRRSKQDHVAPLMLLPVELGERAGDTGYVIRPTDDQLIFNVTLFEYLKQHFGIDMSNVMRIAAEDGGQNTAAIDNEVEKNVQKAFAAMRLTLQDRTGWNVHEDCTLGLYSFSKFVMWNDIHQNAERMTQNPIVGSLVNGALQLTDVPTADARALDLSTEPKSLALPIDVDSSQLEAIVDAGEGKSFLLYGPPGTGKSQTITNMVANALYQGKRVLFVAQKMAALSVVQKRLERIGLGAFCLELHSNKATKSHIVEQLDEALQLAASVTSARDYAEKSEKLYNRRKELVGYMQALHEVQPNGLTLFDCIIRYMSIEEDEAPLSFESAARMNASVMDEVEACLTQLDIVFGSMGHPAQHPLNGLYPHSTAPADVDALYTELRQLRDCLANANIEYPRYQALLQAYPADLRQRYQEVEGAFMLVKPFKKRSLLNELRLADSQLEWDRIPALCDRLDHCRRLTTILANLERMADFTCLSDKSAMLQTLDRWLANRDKLRAWNQWTTRRKMLREKGLESVLTWMLDNHKTGAATITALHKAVYHQLTQHAIDNNAQLREFDSMIFEDKIQRYRDLAAEFQQLTSQELQMRIAKRVSALMDVGQSEEVKAEMYKLQRYIRQKGKGVTIRSMVTNLPHVLPVLCPCMLMSPISVAQYISMANEDALFDLVIFDEASQIPTSEAVGSIARGKAAVIVGDPKQMPPTSFFEAQTATDEDVEFDDMESILDDCITLSMPSRQLTWHYRSRHESLIAFSNVNYYMGQLRTFPSVDDRASHVRFRFVQDGIYDMGATRTNRKEAEAIVDYIVAHYSGNEEERLSLGVISFNTHQQALIEDLLAERLAHHPSLEKRTREGEEPLFIKNLENVQGDERDVILFSVGFGPDRDGNYSMNFGPLNQTGGERRLNVAVSRARQQMVVFSSMRSENIDLSRTQAQGVKGLKNFLYFAESGTQPILASQNQAASYENGLALMIAEQLRQRGYTVDTFVGRSSFRVDVAVVDPVHTDRYVLGILCDGENYYATPTTRDREIVQIEVLEGLGWHIMRAWSVDWLADPAAVILRIMAELPDPTAEPEESVQDEPVGPAQDDSHQEQDDDQPAQDGHLSVIDDPQSADEKQKVKKISDRNND